jgi:hypothetical protein
MIWQILREQRVGSQGIIMPCFHHATSGWFMIGSSHGLVGFDEAESCFLAMSKGDLRIQKLLNPLLLLYRYFDMTMMTFQRHDDAFQHYRILYIIK